jgi:outer membrane protein TolC
MRLTKKIIAFWALCLSNTMEGQQILPIEEAVIIALQHNYNVQIAKVSAAVDKTNNTAGNAGFLPQVALNFGQNYNYNNTKQEFFSGDIREGTNVMTNNLNANVQLAWTLFDGMRMFVNRDRLREIESLGQLNVKLQMENTVHQVMNLYFNIDQQQKKIETIRKAIQISVERRDLAKLKAEAGSGSGLSVLQAEVDINADSSVLLRQILVLKNSKTQLNEMLGRTPETTFEISDFKEPEGVDFNTLQDRAEKRNILLQMADKNIRLAQLRVNQWEANKYPTIDINLGYNFSRLKAEIGILKFNQNAGYAFGLTGRWNIFDGWNNNREIQIAKLGIETANLTKEQTALSLKTDLFTLYNNYITAIEISKIEDNNISIAQQNLDITSDKMRIGTINSLELRQAQLNLVDSQFRKISAQFEARVSLLELYRIAGILLD